MLCNSKMPFSREEKSVPTSVPLHLFLVVFFWIELLPHAGGKDVLVPFVPSAIDHFGVRGVIVGSLHRSSLYRFRFLVLGSAR